MTVYPTQDSFVRGEISPRLHSRAGLDLYRSALAVCENFITLPHGGLRKRSGTYFAGATKNNAAERPVPFLFSETQAYMLFFGDLYFRVYAYGGPVMDGPSVVEVVTPYALADIEALQFEQSGDVLYVTHQSHLPRKITRLSNTSWSIAAVEYVDGPFGTGNVDEDVKVYVSSDPIIKAVTDITQDDPAVVTVAGHGLFTGQQVTFSGVGGMVEVNGQTYTATYIDNNTFSIGIDATVFTAYTSGGTIQIIGAVPVGENITLTASSAIFTSEMIGQLVKVEVESYEKWKPWESGGYLTTTGVNGIFRRHNGNVYQAIEPLSVAGKIRMGGTPPSHLKGEEWDGAGETPESYNGVGAGFNDNYGVKWSYRHSGFGVARIASIGGGGTTAVAVVVVQFPEELIGVANASYRWTVGAFGGANGYPRSAAIFEERLIYGQKYSVYGSKTFDFESFRSGAADDDGLSFQLAGASDITWLAESDGFLLIGTIGGVRTLSGGGQNEQLTPSKFKNRGSPTKRCSSIPPVKAGSTFMYVGFDRKSVVEMGFSLERSGYLTTPVSIISEHIAKRGISSICYQNEPDPVFWMGLDDGQLSGLTYEADQNVRGWHRHKIGGSFGNYDYGVVEWAASTPGQTGADDVWLIVKRTIGGQTRRYIEVIQPSFEYGDVEDAFFVDCGLTYEGAAVSSVTGLSHLEGETVVALADGRIHRGLQVASGAVTLPVAASKIHVGFPYGAVGETLELDVGGRDGSVMGRRKQVNSVIFSVLETANIYVRSVARPADGLFKAGRNTIALESDTVRLYTGNLDEVKLFDTWEGQGRLRIEAPDPVPCTVRAIIPGFDSEGS